MAYPKATEELLEQQHLEFERTRNPMILWRAYRLARSFPEVAAGFPSELEWISEAFDEIAEGFERIAAGAASDVDWHSAVLRNLGFQESVRGGPSSPFLMDARNADWRQFAVHMRVLIDHDGHQETYAADQVADQWGVSATTVRRAWKAYSESVRGENLEQQYSNVKGVGLFISLYGRRSLLRYYGKIEITPEVSEACLKLLGF